LRECTLAVPGGHVAALDPVARHDFMAVLLIAATVWLVRRRAA
jgi:hypothetical protein